MADDDFAVRDRHELIADIVRLRKALLEIVELDRLPIRPAHRMVEIARAALEDTGDGR